MMPVDPLYGPLNFAAQGDSKCALAIVIRTHGPAYRGIGSVMAISADGGITGSLSSGCIEADIAAQAIQAMAQNEPRLLHYGANSPYIDLRLPCGGAIDILLIPGPDKAALQSALAAVSARKAISLFANIMDGTLCLEHNNLDSSSTFELKLRPNLRFLIFGNGAEVLHFTKLTSSLGYAAECFAPDMMTVTTLRAAGFHVTHLKNYKDIPLPRVDPWTAIVLFFHDHDWEPPILKMALGSSAFFIGAQGSYLARNNRDFALRDMGVLDEAIEQISGPIGLIPSARDPRTLSVSVLAEILQQSQAAGL
jgi:xanthine dehydrogenase accessory factor